MKWARRSDEKRKDSDQTILTNEMVRWIRILAKKGCIPFLWVSKSHTIKNVDGFWRKFLFFIHVILCGLGALLLGLQSWFCFKSACPPRYQIRLSAGCFIYICLTLIHAFMYVNKEEFILLIRELYSLQRHLSSASTESTPAKKLKWFVRAFRLYPTAVAASVAMLSLTDPTRPTAATSLVADSSNLGFKIRLGISLLHFTLVHTAGTVFVFNLCLNVFCLHLMAPALHTLRISSVKFGHSLTVADLATQYTALQTLQTLATTCFRFWLMLVTLGFMQLLFLYVYMALALRQANFLMVASGFFIGTTAIIRLAGDVHQESKVVLESWNHVDMPEWFRKYRKACRPIKVGVGSWFFMDHHYFLTFIHVVASSTISFHISVSTA